jgi:tRNA(Ile)-lysidine synthase
MNPLLKTVRETVAEFRMIQPGDRVTAAVSGGPDSVGMVHLLNSFRYESNFKLSLCHVHHGLRGREADEDAEFVADLAKRLSVPFTIKKIDSSEYRVTPKRSLQEMARDLRYAFFLT